MIVAVLTSEIVVLGGATEGEAETPPESAKAAGRKVPKISRNETAVRIEATKPLCPVIKSKASYYRIWAEFI